MTLCIKLGSNKRATCKPTPGGVAKAWIFDGLDFDFTQAAAVNGVAQVYTAIAASAGIVAPATANVYAIEFQRDECELSWKQSSKGGYYTKYEYTLQFMSPDISQLATTWNQMIDLAGNCCGIGLAVLLNSGRIFILGEKIVNGDLLDIPLLMYSDGSSATSGKLQDDANAYTSVLKGNFSRPPYEYTGGALALEAFQ